jgi:hypothetical protein
MMKKGEAMDVTKQISDGSEWFETTEEPVHFSEAEVDRATNAKASSARDAQKRRKR